MNILAKSISHSRATLSVIVFILVAGLGSRALMNIELTPNIKVPVVLVNVVHQGISPEDANRLLVKPLEAELKSLDGIEELNATATEGRIYIIIEFDINEDIDAALANVREAVDRAKSEFPDETEEPVIKEASASPEPTLMIALSGNGVSERELFRVVKTLRRQIETLPAVLEANLSGAREEVVEVVIDPQQLEYYNITPMEFLAAVRGNNLLVPAGEYDTAQGRFGIKVPGLIEDRFDVLSLPVKSTPQSVVTLADVAEIRRTFKDPSSFSHINGRKALSIEVFKRYQANAIDTVATVKQLISEAQLPENIQVDYVFDVSDFTVQMVDELQGNILTAVILVMSVVVAALGIRTGILVGFGIPFSLLGAMIVAYQMGFSINFMVIFGLLLALGMLIDGAIVIMEYAETQYKQGKSLQQSYVNAVRRMALPVIASTATTLAVFLPLLFWPGVAGRFMSYLPYTVFAVLSWSLLYALFFGPVLGVILGRILLQKQVAEAGGKNYVRRSDASFAVLGQAYHRLLEGLLQRPFQSVGVALALLLIIFIAYGKFGRGMEFFVETEERYGIVAVRAQGNLDVAEKERLSVAVEQRILSVSGVKALHASGSQSSVGNELGAEKDQISRMLVELTAATERSKSSMAVFEDIRQQVADLPGIFVTANQIQGGPPVGKDLQLQLSGKNRELLRAEAYKVREYLETKVEGLRDIDDTLPLPGIDWELKVDRAEAAMLGVDTLAVGNMVQLVTSGIEIGEFRPDDSEDEVEIRVRYPADNRGIVVLDELRVTTPNGPVPISSFVKRSARTKVSSIQRIDQQEVIFVRANTEDGVLADDKVKEIQRWLDEGTLDPGVDVVFKGANEEQKKSIAFLSRAFSMALFLMLILMVMQFNSFYQAFLIMSAVVMSTAGVLLGLLLMQQALSVIMGGVGIVALAGIVVNNNIVLIDTFNHLRRENPTWSTAEAALESAVLRLRPVLLTTITTAVGLLPLATNISLDVMNRSVSVGGEVASWWQQLAAVIVNGLLFSTFLTLLLTPVMLALPEYLHQRFFARSQWAEQEG